MSIVLDGTSGITNDSGYTGDGVSFADSTPANTLVTTSGGNVGMGTGSPVAASLLTLKKTSAGGDGAELRLINSSTTVETATQIVFTNTTTDSGNSAVIKAVRTAGGQDFRFASDGTERMRIASDGDLLVGTTSQFNSSFVNILCDANAKTPLGIKSSSSAANSYFIRFVNNSGTDIGAVVINGSNNGVSYATSSDYRLKHDIAPMTGALARVAALKPCTYKWNSDGSDAEGFIAHELQEVCPSAVTGEKDAVETYTDEDGVEQTRPKYQGIDTSFLVATLTAAIQEQQAIIESLTARVVALEGQP